MDKKLDCCVVRDLLPAYIEDLTEKETAAQVREHLEDCGACQSLERDTRSQEPREKTPEVSLHFFTTVYSAPPITAVVSLSHSVCGHARRDVA